MQYTEETLSNLLFYWTKDSEPDAQKSPCFFNALEQSGRPVGTDDMIVWYLLKYSFLLNTYEYGL